MEKEIPSTPKKGNKKLIQLIFAAILLAAAGFGVKETMYSLHHETTDNAQIEGHTYPVISRVSGYIKKLKVSDYGQVGATDTLVYIEDEEYRIAVDRVKGDYQLAKANLKEAEANKLSTEARLRVARSNAQVVSIQKEKATTDLNRAKALFADNALTKKALEDAEAQFQTISQQYQVAQNEIILAKSNLQVAESEVIKAHSSVEIKKAALDQAVLDLSYTKIPAPGSGRIGKLQVEPGQFVKAGQPLFTIVDDKDFYVVANMKETQLEHIQVGQEAEVMIDSYPDLALKGKVETISRATGAKFSLLPPDNATGNFVKVVQRVPVVIRLTDVKQHMDLLRAGLSVEVSLSY
ncbi:HlyD family secretion protein [Limibacter armeniacum]|uniref:HlyD family secretion protein n=1 Tax=Limibacter armeniacum TaxID=466084 RepID=UPI002FE55499